MKKIDETPAYFAPEKAEAVAKELKANDPDWTYEAAHAPGGEGLSRVRILDEDGEFVAFLTSAS